MFRRKLSIVFCVMLCFSMISFGLISAFGRKPVDVSKDDIVVVASIYPVYLITKNLCDGVDGVHVVNLTENLTGCSHDYQLTTKDMLMLETADILVINGGEMELFITGAAEKLSSVTIVDSSMGISFLSGNAHTHKEDSFDTDENDKKNNSADMDKQSSNTQKTEGIDVHDTEIHSSINGHIWLDMVRYEKQIAAVAEALGKIDTAHADQYFANAERYIMEVETLYKEYQKKLAELQDLEVVLFHDAFYYLCDTYSIEVLHGVDLDAESALSAGELAELADEVRFHNVQYFFAEEATGDAAVQLAGETGSSVIFLDPITSGPDKLDAYLTAMRQNLELLFNCCKTKK